METVFTEKELIDFGKFLQSTERANQITRHHNRMATEAINSVSHADVENFKEMLRCKAGKEETNCCAPQEPKDKQSRY